MVVPVSLLNKQQTLKQSSMQTEFHTRPRRGTSSVLLESRWIVSTYMMHMALLPSSAALSPSARCYTLFWQVVLPFHSGGSCVSQGFLVVWWLLLKAVLKKKKTCKILEMDYTCMPQHATHRSTADILVLYPPILLKNTLRTPMNAIIQYSSTILNDPQYLM